MESLLLYSGVGDADVQWLVLDKSGSPVGGPQQGELDTAAAQAVGRGVIWAIKGEDVWLAQRRLPSGSRRQLAQALPYALEEELAAEVDSLLFAHAPLGERTGVAVIDRELLDTGLARLQQHGLRPRRILPDVLLLPRPDDAWYLRVDGGRAILRKGEVDGFVCERENLPVMLSGAVAAAGDAAPARLLAEGDAALPGDLAGLPAIEPVQAVPLLERLAQGLRTAPRVDFAPLLGSGNLFSKADRRRWQVAAAIALLAVGLSLGERWLAVARLESHNATLDQAIDQTYRDAFPQASRVVNARVQMQQQLDALRRGGSDAGFLAMLGGVVRELATAEGLRVDGMEYRDRLLMLRLQGRDLQQLNGLKQAIERDGRLSTEIQSVNQEAAGVSAQLKIREGRA